MTYLYDDDYYKFSTDLPKFFNLYTRPTSICSSSITFSIITDNGNDTFFVGTNANSIEASTLPVGLQAGNFFLKVRTNSNNFCPYEFSLTQDTSAAIPVVMSNIVDSTTIKDINSNGSEELVLLKVKSNAKSTIEIKDPKTKSTIREFTFVTDSRTLQPIKLTTFIDLNGDAKPDIGVLAFNRTANKYMQYFYNATTGTLITGSSFTVTP